MLPELVPYQEFAEWLTVIVSLAGMYAAMRYYIKLKKVKTDTARGFRRIFATDFGVYAVTLVMGLALFYDWPLVVQIDVIVRPFVLMLNVGASVHLLYNIEKQGREL